MHPTESKMAAKLEEGREYGLASNVSTIGNKTFIHFKLTDSALRALEEFSKIKNGCTRKPTIQFTHSDGVMKIPGQVSSEDPRAERSFKLNLAKIHSDPNGSFDCIQQNSSCGLQCRGCMQYKVSTHANSDVYSDTRKKIAIADNESKKYCAKEIKMSGRFSGKKIKKVIPSNQYNAMHPSRPASLPLPRHTASSSLTSSSNPHHMSSTNGRLTSSPSNVHSSHNPVNGHRAASKPASLVSSNNGILKIGNRDGNKPPSGAMNMPFRDRVIHLLALRSYKKPELIYRLMKDGVREDDKDSIGTLLKSISVMNKDSSYSLTKHAWQSVRSDWPLYSDADRQLLKRNQLQMEARSSVSPSVSPTVRPSDSPSPPQKRSGEDIDVIPAKKQRISHHDKRHQNQPNGKLPKENPSAVNTNGTYNHHSHRSSNGVTPTATNGVHDKESPIPESPSSNCENQGKADDPDSPIPDYTSQYSKIVSCSQRQQYKEIFQKEYEEYRRLHEKVQYVSRRFQHLKEDINKTVEGSRDYEELRKKVLQEYKQQKSDAQFLQRKQRVDYLHAKLGYIKELILEYDKIHHVTDCS